jgi:tRNA pseudouridine38-40 synthase
MAVFKLTVAYDGQDFVGWQRQATGASIQGVLEDIIGELEGKPVTVTGAGRTDAGVHARSQIAAVALDRSIDGPTLVRAVNARLPPAIRLTDACIVRDTFHPRFDAAAKAYSYRIWNASVLDPFERRYVWHIPAPTLDVDAMDEGARLIEGRHDFAAFQGTGSATASTEREVFSSIVRRAPASDLVTYEICGAGFLRYMVRTLVGTLVEVGSRRQPARWVADVLASRDRSRAGRTAPPEGLFLERVEYQDAVYNQHLPPRNPHVA